MSEIKEYTIWIGFYQLPDGQSTQARKLATLPATTFKLACLRYELAVKLEFIGAMEEQGHFIDDNNCEWFYDYKNNRNKFTGPYFETEEEAAASFPKPPSIISPI